MKYAEKCIQVDNSAFTVTEGYTVSEFVPEDKYPSYCSLLGYEPELKPDNGFYIRLEPEEREALVAILKREMERLEERMQDHEPGSWFHEKDKEDWKQVKYFHFLCTGGPY